MQTGTTKTKTDQEEELVAVITVDEELLCNREDFENHRGMRDTQNVLTMASIYPSGYNSDRSEEEAISTFVKEGESKNSGSGG
jgi:hypothetical protein